jgi:solute carrier family 13 (sodium-dependent dicarboxylate transporter), member 2/3/5
VATIIGSPPNGIAVRYVQQTFGMNPYVLILACTLGASSAYMMPVGTPPNAIVFGTGLVRLPQMMKAGFWLNLAGILVITALVTLLITPLLGTSIGKVAR